MMKTTAFVVCPLMFGLSAVSRPLIYFTIGAKWALCAQILQIICFMFLFLPLQSLSINLLQAMGRSDLSLRISIIGKVLSVIVLVSSLPFGIIPMCWLSVVSSVVILAINLYHVGNLLNIGLLEQLKDLAPSFGLSSVMFLAVVLSVEMFTADWLKLVVGVSVGMGLYVGCAYVFKLKNLSDTLDVVRIMVHK